MKGCDRDGGKLLEKLRGIGGSKRQQMQTLDDKISAHGHVQDGPPAPRSQTPLHVQSTANARLGSARSDRKRVSMSDETLRKPIVIPYLEGAGHCTGQGMAGATAPGTGELGVPSLPPACDSA